VYLVSNKLNLRRIEITKNIQIKHTFINNLTVYRYNFNIKLIKIFVLFIWGNVSGESINRF